MRVVLRKATLDDQAAIEKVIAKSLRSLSFGDYQVPVGEDVEIECVRMSKDL